MPEEKQPKAGSWKEDLERASDSGFNQEKVWNSLQARLHSEKPSRRIAWYWMAAAGLLLFLVTWFLFPRKADHSRLVSTDKPKQAKSSVRELTGKKMSKMDQVAMETPGQQVRNQPFAGHQIKKSALQQTSDNTFYQSGLDSMAQFSDLSVNPPAIRSHDTLVALIKPKQSLRVVHLNELGEEPIGDQANSNTWVRRGFAVRLNGESGSENHAIADRPSGKSLFKIRLNTQN